MNHLKKLYLLLPLFFIIFSACTEEKEKPTLEKPVAITDYEVEPIYGGAVITYTIPNDPNILCVTAEYERNGEPFMERASYYKNSVRIEGFRTDDPVTVKLYTENANEDRSEPIVLQFKPLKGLVDLTQESLNFITTFGGIVLDWENISGTELSIRLLSFIDGEVAREDIYFSTITEERHSFRGFDPVETTYAVIIGDKWKNESDTAFYTTTPIFEMEIPKPWGDMRAYIKSDNQTEHPQGTHTFNKLYDGLIGTNSYGYLNQSNSEGTSFTVDLKEIFKLSRFKFWPSLRTRNEPQDVYGNVNLTEFEIWGSPVLDTTKPDSYWEEGEDTTGTFKEDWEYLGYFVRERLDLLGATDDELWQRGAVDGDEFELPLELKPVRYIRVFARAISSGKPIPNNYWQLGELSFFGTNNIE